MTAPAGPGVTTPRPSTGVGASPGRGGGSGSVARALLGRASWSVAAQLTPVVVNLLLTPFLIHGIGITQYGIYALVATVTIFLSSFDGGIGSTTQRYFSLHAGRDDRDASTRLMCTLVLLVTAATVVFSVADWYLSPLIAQLFGVPVHYRGAATFLLRTFGLLVGINLLHSLFVSLLQAHGRFAVTGRSVICSYLAWSAGVVVAVQDHTGLRGIAIALIAEQVVATALILPASRRHLSWRSAGLLSRAELKSFFGYASRVQTMGLASLIALQFDALIIGAFLTVRDVGLYNAGANVATQVRYVATSMLPPAATRMANTFGAEGPDAAREEMARLQRLWVVATCGWSAAALGACYFAVLAWLGPRFELSAVVCTVLLAGHAVNLLTGVMTAYAGAIGQPGVESRYGVLCTVVNVVLTLPLVLLGVLGVVSATTVGAILGSLYLIRVVHRRLSADVPSFLPDVPVVAALACLAVTAGLEWLARPVIPGGPLGLLACGLPAIVGLAVYAVSFLGPRRSWTVVRSIADRSFSLDLVQ